MKITVEWLKEFVETDASPAEIGHELTMLGLELEAAEESALGPVLDFKVTPNRGDCLSVFGLARELAAKDAQRYRPNKLFQRAASSFTRPSASDSLLAGNDSPLAENDSPLVTIEAPELCPRYVGQVIRGVRVGACPEKIAARLTACGMRPIDSIVDTTNYVMLELGQPLHAFDLRQLKGGRIVVRTARAGETMRSLDGQERKLSPDMLMICDAERPVAIAGVMGGENSEVAADTTEILLESAHFDPVSIRRTRKALGMSTEASYRFERYVDPELCLAACRRVCELLGVAGEPEFDAYPGRTGREAIVVREKRWNRLLGMQVPNASAAAMLNGLGCRVSEVDGGLSVVPPSWRSDLLIEEDLVEEIGRLWGYEHIPELLPFGSTPQGGLGPEAAFRQRVKAAMLRLGFEETLTHTLVAGSLLAGSGEPVEVRNAASPELSELRRSILPGLAEVASRNRGRPLALFEVGRVFGPGERRSIAMLASGEVAAPHWDGGKAARYDFYSMKGVVEEFGELLGRPLGFAPSSDARFHPGRRASIEIDGKPIGVMGEVSPTIADQLDLATGSLAAEVDLDALLSSTERPSVYRRLSPFPAVRRDFAVVMPTGVAYATIEAALREAAEPLAERVWLFDVYSGKGIEDGYHSLGIGVSLRHAERTLTDEEANAFSERAFSALEALGGRRRT